MIRTVKWLVFDWIFVWLVISSTVCVFLQGCWRCSCFNVKFTSCSWERCERVHNYLLPDHLWDWGHDYGECAARCHDQSRRKMTRQVGWPLIFISLLLKAKLTDSTLYLHLASSILKLSSHIHCHLLHFQFRNQILLFYFLYPSPICCVFAQANFCLFCSPFVIFLSSKHCLPASTKPTYNIWIFPQLKPVIKIDNQYLVLKKTLRAKSLA